MARKKDEFATKKPKKGALLPPQQDPPKPHGDELSAAPDAAESRSVRKPSSARRESEPGAQPGQTQQPKPERRTRPRQTNRSESVSGEAAAEAEKPGRRPRRGESPLKDALRSEGSPLPRKGDSVTISLPQYPDVSPDDDDSAKLGPDDGNSEWLDSVRVPDEGDFASLSGNDRAETPAVRGEEPHAAEWEMGEWDIHLFNEGTHQRLFEKLGAHPVTRDGVEGVQFSVWAPAAREVFVIGDFNGWTPGSHSMNAVASSGIWTTFIAGVSKGAHYKFQIVSHARGYSVAKADPFGFFHEVPPHTASRVWDLDYEWNDGEWMRDRARRNALHAPISIYEIHLGSWRRNPEENYRSLTYAELAEDLPRYMREMGFTHVEFLPVMEHPFFGSWGYQTTGYFAPTSRFGTPQDFMTLIDALHQSGIGVILDWVPSHFPTDEHGLGYFDGTHLFEHSDPRQGFHPDWQSAIFNYGRNEVRAFLISSAMFWLEKYHIDGLRVDAVASMLYLDYSRKHGEWIPNRYGGRDNIEAIDFLRQLNRAVYESFPDTQTIAEESTAWPMVSRPTYVGGLGFGMKWDMGWMHDTLKYMSHDPVFRRFHHNELTFRGMYAFTENFVLPLSHDEVVHGKGSLIGKMPGDEWQKFANLRLLFSYMYASPGKKLLFMGGEIAQGREWNHDDSLEWDVLQLPMHSGVQSLLKDLNRLYRDHASLNEQDTDAAGFEWLDANDSEQSVLSFIRHSKDNDHPIIAIFNFTPVVRENYMVGAPLGGWWSEIFNSDAADYGGSGIGNLGGVEASPVSYHGRRYSLNVTLPPLGCVFFKAKEETPAEE